MNVHVVDHLEYDLSHRKGRLQFVYNNKIEGFDAVIQELEHQLLLWYGGC
jgi:hypothetical protein